MKLDQATAEWAKDNLFHFPKFSEQYLKIRTKDGELKPFVLNEPQKIVWDIIQKNHDQGKLHRYIVLKARQEGMSTFFSGYTYHKILTNTHKQALVVGHEKEASNNLFNMMKRFEAKLPPPLKPTVKASNEKILAYEKLESEVKIMTAEGRDSLGRSGTVNYALLTEVAFWPDIKSSLNAVFQCVPDVQESLIVIESTANGFNGFYDLWRDAEDGVNDFTPIFLGWNMMKEYARPFKDHMAMVNFKATLNDEEKTLRETFKLKYTQLNWRRWAIANKCGGDINLFRQEYPCLIGSTQIMTDRGIEPISEAIPAGVIKNWFYQGEKQCYLLRTKMGYEVEATDNHKFLTPNGYVELKDLKPGDLVKIGRYEFSKEIQTIRWKEFFSERSVEITPDFALFLGIFMGDGDYYYKTGTIGVACAKECPDFVEVVRALIKKYFGDPGEKMTGNKKGCHYLRKAAKKSQDLFERLGLLKDSGHGSRKRKVHVPEYIKKSPKEVVKQFLKGVFETDGFIDRVGNRTILFSKYKHFIQDVQLLLLGFGITSKLNTVQKLSGGGQSYTGYELQLRKEETNMFCNEIGFISEKKRSRQNNRKSRYCHAQITMTHEDEIVSITPTVIQPVYDVETESHQIIANGLITHNCSPHEAFVASGRPVLDIQICQKNHQLCKPPIRQGYLVHRKDDVIFYDDPKGYIKIYREIEYEHDAMYRYAAGTDVAEGLASGDYSVVPILDRKYNEVVMTWHGHIDPDLLAREIVLIEKYLKKQVHFCIERNNHGLTVINRCYDYNVNMYYAVDYNKGRPQSTDNLGFKTTTITKKTIIDRLVEFVREGLFISNEKEFWNETFTFVRDERGRMQAQGKDRPNSKTHDDRIMAYALMLECSMWLPSYSRKNPEVVRRSGTRDDLKYALSAGGGVTKF